MKNSSKIRVLLVDDHPLILAGLRSFLVAAGEFEVIGEAGNGQEALDKAQVLHPDVVVMNLAMPIMDGLEATRQLRQSAPEIKVLILTGHQTYEVASIVESGARGYVSKNEPPVELARGIRSILRGETFFRPKITTEDSAADTSRAKTLKGDELSNREWEVLKLVAEGHSNKAAAGILGVSVRTIEKHRERIMRKLNLHSIVELTKFAVAKQIVQVD